MKLPRIYKSLFDAGRPHERIPVEWIGRRFVAPEETVEWRCHLFDDYCSGIIKLALVRPVKNALGPAARVALVQIADLFSVDDRLTIVAKAIRSEGRLDEVDPGYSLPTGMLFTIKPK